MPKGNEAALERGLGIAEVLLPFREKILELAARHGVGNVRVFGSVARGEARSDSDVDLLVDLPPGKTLFDLGGFTADLEELLGRKVDVTTPTDLRQEFRRIVPRDARPL